MALEPLYLKVAAYAAMSCYCLLRDADLPGGAEGGVDAATDLFAFWVNGRQRNRYDHILNQVAADLRRLAEAEYRGDPDAAEPVLVTVQDLLRHHAPRSRELVGAGLVESAIAARVLADGRARGRLGRPGDIDEGFCRRAIEQVYARLLAERAFLESLDLEVTRALLQTPERTADELKRRGVSQEGMQDALRRTLAEIGLTPDLVARLGRGEASEEERRRLELLEARTGLTDAALTTFFRILGEKAVAAEQLEPRLIEIAERHVALTERLRALTNDDPAVAGLRTEAAAAIEAGAYDRADQLLSVAEDADLAAARIAENLAHQAQEAAERRFLHAAATRAERGELSLTRLDDLTAAEHFRQAAEIVPRSALEARADYRNRYANALWQHGDQKGDNAALLQAIGIHKQTLAELPREAAPLAWVTTQTNLGIAVATLGRREAGTARLEEAVEAFCAALAEYTRERAPLTWAAIQLNLGAALRALGEREAGTARLNEAVAAHRAALAEYARERAPLDWARTQSNLGNALQTLGEREAGTARLKEAVAAHRAALAERTRERVPLDWAQTQNNLGNALRALGEREAGTARLEEAVEACEAALAERTRERTPLDWAQTQNNLGNALATLGAREAGTARLEQAVAAYTATLAEYTRERAPLQWAMTQNNLGNALWTLGVREAGTARLEEAVAAFRAALAERTRERAPLDWAQTQNNLGNALLTLRQREERPDLFAEALPAIEGAFEVYMAAGLVQYEAYFRARIEELQGLVEQVRRAG